MANDTPQGVSDLAREEPDDGRRRPTSRELLFLAIVLAVSLLAFFPALDAELLDWDDNLTVSDNPRLDDDWSGFVPWAFTTFFMGHYQPLSWLSLRLDTALFGRSSFGYHFTNLLLHALNVILVWALARHFTGRVLAREARDDRATRPPVAAPPWATALVPALAALLFAVHPMRVESVVWVTERRDVLSALFLFAALWLYLSSFDGRMLSRARLASSWASFVLSLLAKASGVTFVGLILLIDVFVHQRLRTPWLSRTNVAVLAQKLPFLLVAAAAALIAPRAQAATRALISWDVLGLGERLLLMAHGWLYYLRKSLWPSPLSHLYELPLEIELLSWRFGGSVVALVGAALLTALLFKRLGPGPWRRGLLVVGAAYTLLLLPVLGLFQSGPQLVADRYSYLPSAIVLVALAAGAATTKRPVLVRIVIGGSLVAAGLALQTLLYASTWRTDESLWENSLRADPNCAYCLEGAATTRLESGQRDLALTAFEQALRLRPNLFKANTQVAMLLEHSDPERARQHYFRAHRLRPDLPILLERGAALSARVGDTETARAAYERLLSWQPRSLELWQRALDVELAARECPNARTLVSRARDVLSNESEATRSSSGAFSLWSSGHIVELMTVAPSPRVSADTLTGH